MPEDFGLNPRGVQTLFEEQSPDVALKAVTAAIQYQGMRGYQQALKNGESAEKAMTKFAPSMFYGSKQGIGPSIRAVTPPPIRPSDTLAREKFEFSKTNVPPPVVTESIRTIPNPSDLLRLNTPTINVTNRTTRGVSPLPIKPPAPATNAPSQRVARANALAKEHPDWTKAQILETVSKELK